MAFARILLFTLLVSSSLCQSYYELEEQLGKERATFQVYEHFLNMLEVHNHEIDYYRDTIYAMLPTISSLRPIYAFAAAHFDDDNYKLDPAKEGFHFMNKQIGSIDIALSQYLHNQPPTDNTTILSWYKKQRSPISVVEENVRLFASAINSRERQHYLRALRDECQKTYPTQFFEDYPHKTRSASQSESVSTLSANHEKDKLITWVKLITGDAVRALTMHQACLGVSLRPVSQVMADQYLENAWIRINDIFQDLKKEADRVEKHIEEKLLGQVGYQVYADIAQFAPNDNNTHIARTLQQTMLTKYPSKYFGVFVLQGPFDKQVYDKKHAIEVPFGDRTILVFWVERDDLSKDRQEKIKSAIDSVDCAPPNRANHYRSETLDILGEPLRHMGVKAIYVTDGNYGGSSYPAAGFRKTCTGAEEEPRKRTWTYYRGVLVAY